MPGVSIRSSPKPRLLCVDDEPHVLESLRDKLRRRFDVEVTTNGFEALKILTDHPCAVVLSDMRMPLINGARFLTLAREHAPDTVRVMLTGHSALPDAMAAVNQGEIYRLLLKPCASEDLIAVLGSAVEHHEALTRDREQFDASARGLVSALFAMASEIDPDTAARADRLCKQVVEFATYAKGVTPSPELERAAKLTQLGAVGLSAEARARLARGARLSREQATELERLPELAAGFIRDIPLLQATAAVLLSASRPFIAPRAHVEGTLPAAAVLRIVLDFELLERQEAPMETALERMAGRSGRYSPALLTSFQDFVRFG